MPLHLRILVGMIVGALAGGLLGPRSPWLPQTGIETAGLAPLAAPAPDAAAVPISDRASAVRVAQELTGESGAWLLLTWTERDDSGASAARFGWIPAGGAARYAPAGRALVTATEWMGRVFLALIRFVVAPLVFFSLIVGVASLGDVRRLGRIGARTLAYFTGTTAVAVAIGVTLAGVVQPGAAVSESSRAALLAAHGDQASTVVANAARAPAMLDQLVAIVPANLFGALAAGDMLQILIAAILFGVALTLMPEPRAQPLVELADRLNELVVTVVLMALQLAPIGVAALMLKVTATAGFAILGALGAYSAVVLVGLLVHVALVYIPVVTFAARTRPDAFFRAMRPALALAFSSSSSSATLPVTQRCVEDNLGVSREVSAFVLPLGATVNMDGTALYQGVAAMFIAQVFHMELTWVQEVQIVVMATLASIGAAGVPGAGMITLAMVLTSIGVPVEGIALIVGVDRILDMARTSINVLGDAAAAAAVATWEGEVVTPRTVEDDLADETSGFERRFSRGDHPVPPRGA